MSIIANHSSLPGESCSALQRLQAVGAAGRIRWMTTKRDFRARAHSNPLNDGAFEAPLTPQHFQRALPDLFGLPPGTTLDQTGQALHVHWCDLGCGYGGLLASLSAAFPDKKMVGLEIRERVAQFCKERIAELRAEHECVNGNSSSESGQPYTNVGFVRTNAMKFLPNYFAKGSLEKIFFCYPDPHFKRRKHRQRVISDQLLAEYAYVLTPGIGVAYIVTDVPELFEWMDERFARCPMFRRRTKLEIDSDPVVGFVRDMTDEAARVEKSQGQKLDASFIRIS
jgi:tRNA (guanine-N7-)-methyltransferase